MIEEYRAAQFKQLVRGTYLVVELSFTTSKKLSAFSNFENDGLRQYQNNQEVHPPFASS